MTTTEAPVQLGFLPDLDIPRHLDHVPLDRLPADAALVGDPDPVLLQTVKEYGVIVPIVLVERTDRTLVVAEGRRRIKAARAARIPLIAAEVWETDAPIAHVLTLITNEVRKANEVSEFEAYRALQRQGLDDERVCQVTGIHPTKLHRLAGLSRLSEPLLEGLRRGKVSFTVGLAAAACPERIQEALAEALAREGRLTGADILAARQADKAATASAQAPLLLGPESAAVPHEAVAAEEADDSAETAVFYQYLGAWVYRSLAERYPTLENVEEQDDGTLLLQLDGGELRTVRVAVEEVEA